jgi:hypothetical protein
MANRIEESHPYLEDHIVFTEEEAGSLRRLCAKTDLRSRGQCLAWICGGCSWISEDDASANVGAVASVLEVLIQDRRHCVRDKAAWALASIARWCSDDVWPVVARLEARGKRKLATLVLHEVLAVLLDSFFFNHFDECFPRVRAAIEAGDEPMLAALWALRHRGRLAKRASEVDPLLLAHGLDPTPSVEASGCGCRTRRYPRRACDRVLNRVEGSHPLFHEGGRLRLNAAERKSLRRLGQTVDPQSRGRLCAWVDVLARYPWSAGNAATADLVFELLEAMANDAQQDVRSQALMLFERRFAERPATAWPVVVRLIHSPDPELAELVPPFILEHILEKHFDRYYPRVRDAVEAGDRRMAEALDGCLILGQAEPHREEIVELLCRHDIVSRYANWQAADEDE